MVCRADFTYFLLAEAPNHAMSVSRGVQYAEWSRCSRPQRRFELQQKYWGGPQCQRQRRQYNGSRHERPRLAGNTATKAMILRRYSCAYIKELENDIWSQA
jgi:hypothetical protein